MAESPAPWSVEYATEVMRHVDRQLALGGLANLVSFRQNAVFHLPHRYLSVRIYGPERPELKAHLMLDVARRLADSDVLAVRPADEFAAQPLVIHGAFVTIWHWLEAHEQRPDLHGVGSVLRRFHEAMDDWPRDIPRFDPLGKIRDRLVRIAEQALLPPPDRAVLESAVEHLDARIKTIAHDETDWLTLHGDATTSNIMLTPNGPALIDFDSVCRGPREWDLVAAIATSSGDHGEAWRELLEGYGVDEGTLTGQDVFTDVKHLSMSVVHCLNASQSLGSEESIGNHIRWWSQWLAGQPSSPFLRLYGR